MSNMSTNLNAVTLQKSNFSADITDEFTRLYCDTMLLLRNLETINPKQLSKALFHYLAVMVAEGGDEQLGNISATVTQEGSWLHDAGLLCQLGSHIETLQNHVKNYNDQDFHAVLLNDCLNQLKYYQTRYDNELITEIEQLNNAIMTCLDSEKLKQHSDEITAYLEEQNIRPLTRSAADTCLRLRQSACVHVLKSRHQQCRKIAIQVELMRTKFLRFCDNFNSNSHFSINQLVALKQEIATCEDEVVLADIEQQLTVDGSSDLNELRRQVVQLNALTDLSQAMIDKYCHHQTQAQECLPAHVFGRVNQSIDSHAATIKQGASAVASEMKTISDWENYYYEAMELIVTQRHNIVKLMSERANAQLEVECVELEQALLRARQLLSDSTNLLADVKFRLSVAVRAKSCYSGFSLSLIFRYVAKQLMALKHSISVIESTVLRELDWQALSGDKDRLAVIQSEQQEVALMLQKALASINDYLGTIQVDQSQFQSAVQVRWQVQLSKQLLKANPSKLEHYYQQLERIGKLSNLYVRGLFIIFFARVENRLSDQLVDQIQLWRVNNVNEVTVVKTMRYFNIAISDKTLLRIAPHIRYHRSSRISNGSGWLVSACNTMIDNVLGVFKKVG